MHSGDTGGRGCNPIPGKIEIRWPSLDFAPLLRYNSISGGWGDCNERRCSGHWCGPRAVALGRCRLGQSVAGRPPSTAGLGVCRRSGFERVLRPDQGARRGGRPAGNRSAGGPGGLALCHAGGDRLGAGDRPAVPAARGLSLAVRRCADQSRPAGDVSARECSVVGPPADPECDRADRRKAGQSGGAGDRRDEEPALAKAGVRAWAGRGSMSKRKRLERIEKAVAERVAELKSELDKDPGEPERRGTRRALQGAQERARRVERAHQKLTELVREQAERAKTHVQEEAEKGEPKVSVSDPEARTMRLADGAVAPAWNVQVATANGFIVAIDPTDRRNDGGLARGLVEKIVERAGRVPQRLLADTTAMTQADIVKLDAHYPQMTVYSPPPPER